MRRVYFIWAGRFIMNRFTAKLALMGILLWQFAALVFVAAVVSNAQHGGAGLVHQASYMAKAFIATNLAVQTIILAIVIFGGWLALDAYRNIRPLLSHSPWAV